MSYCFYLLARICESHLTTSIEQIVERLRLSEDVAGATFLAGASSAPELCTSIISTCILHNASGVGTIVGSAVFNLLVIVGLSAVFSGKGSLNIWWYPTVRDCVWYLISVLEIFLVMLDGLVHWWEAFIMVISYGLYVVYFTQNERIMKKFGLTPPGKTPVTGEGAEDNSGTREEPIQVADACVVQVTVVPPIDLERELNQSPSASTGGEEPGPQTVVSAGDEAPGPQMEAWSVTSSTPERDAKDGPAQSKNLVPAKSKKKKVTKKGNVVNDGRLGSKNPPRQTREAETVTVSPSGSAISDPSKSSHSNDSTQASEGPAATETPDPIRDETTATAFANESAPSNPNESAHSPPSDQKAESAVAECVMPTAPDDEQTAGWCRYEPIMMLINLIMPTGRRWIITLFVLCCAWVSVFTYFAVDASTRLGCLMSLDDEVMGLVILAAGTSVPDTICSVVVARGGMGDMAVANAVGSNIFDILLCLGFPWFVWAAIQGEPIQLPRENILFTIIVLVVCVIGYLTILIGNKWKLTKRMGLSLLVWYVTLIVLVLMQSYG